MKTTVLTSVQKLLGTIAIGGTFAANLMALSPSALASTSTQSGNTQTYVFNDASGPDREQTAEEMALLAESLVRPNTIVQAYKLAFRALEHNQYNIRAQFVLKATQPMMELKGIYKRIEPISRQRASEYRNYLSSVAEMKANKHVPDTYAFLLDGPADLQTEGQVQDVIEKYVEKVDELRDWLKENRKVAHTLNYYVETNGSAAPCTAKETAPNTWVLKNCNRDVQKFSGAMNIADFEMIRQHVSGIQTYIAMTTAYSVDGVFAKSGKLPWYARANTVVPAFSKVNGIGHLRNTKFFAMLPKVTADLVIGMRAAKKMQAEICPKGQSVGGSRKGMLINGGICIEQSSRMDRLISTLDLMAHGRLATTNILTGGKSVKATVDTKTFMQNIPGDVRELGPVSYDKCGDVVAIGDGRINGLFVRGELNAALRQGSIESCRK